MSKPTQAELIDVLRQTADALELILSSEPDMPTFQSSMDQADVQLERARAVLAKVEEE